MRENLILFARKCDDFRRKTLQHLQENVTVFPGYLDDFCTKVWQSLQEHLTIFQENLMILSINSADSYFQLVRVFFIRIIPIQAKLVRFCCKNRQIFLQNSKIFLKNLSNFSANAVKFFCIYLPSKFFCQNLQIFLPKIFKFSCTTSQIFV